MRNLVIYHRADFDWSDFEAISEPCKENHPASLDWSRTTLEPDRPGQAYSQKRATRKMPDNWDTGEGSHGTFHKNGREKGKTVIVPDNYKGSVPGRNGGPGQDRRSSSSRGKNSQSGQRTKENLNANWDAKEAAGLISPTRNARTVWTIATQPYKEAHFATFPEEIPRRCILAGCQEGGVVLDPFGGSGTTGAVALALGRDFILIELNPEYAEMARKRIGSVTPGMRFAEAS